jgi:octanoyl-[GcvH]:protein N-octanoyltransferase
MMESRIAQAVPKIRIIDRSEDLAPHDVRLSFAIEEWWCRHMQSADVPMLHFWRHPRAFVMGLRDSRLSHVSQAKTWLETAGYATAVRHSGGAAVPLDAGVLNVSLLLPKLIGHVQFHEQFHMMTELIQRAVGSLSGEVEYGEIQGAYCPGEYDLSVAGRKFCGMAQRRLQQAISVQAFINVEGTGKARAEVVEQFYQMASHAEEDTLHIAPQATASLQELLQQSVTPARFIRACHQVLLTQGVQVEWFDDQVLPPDAQVEALMLEMRNRYG